MPATLKAFELKQQTLHPHPATLQGYLAHKKTPPSKDIHMALG